MKAEHAEQVVAVVKRALTQKLIRDAEKASEEAAAAAACAAAAAPAAPAASAAAAAAEIKPLSCAVEATIDDFYVTE